MSTAASLGWAQPFPRTGGVPRRPHPNLITNGSPSSGVEVRPRLYSMKTTPDVRDYAVRQKEIEAGMQKKSAGFRERGGEVYLPADVVGAEAEETVTAG